jgi:hypothetical protein
VNSSTYRQSSKVTADGLARDPDNRLLSRGPRFRVEGEIVRDIALAAGGLLNPKVDGASVYPPAPASLFLPPVSYGPKVWKEETGENRFRRAIYTFRYRSVPYPALQAFDTPPGEASCVRRSRSNTPLQALTTLNEALFVECAKALGAKALKEGGATDPERDRLRVPPLHGAAALDGRARRALGFPVDAEEADVGGAGAGEAARRRRRGGRVHRAGAGAVEPRRNDHERVRR